MCLLQTTKQLVTSTGRTRYLAASNQPSLFPVLFPELRFLEEDKILKTLLRATCNAARAYRRRHSVEI